MLDITVGAGLRACPQMMMQDYNPRATTEGCPYNFLKICGKYTFILLIQSVYNLDLSIMKFIVCMPDFIKAYMSFFTLFWIVMNEKNKTKR